MDPTYGLSLDHLVITTGFDLERAQQLFAQLGFTLTEKGEHAFGSVNHLILFSNCYLEIIGVPKNSPVQRKEVLDAPKGIDGLVFNTTDADALHAKLQAQGLPLQPLHAFGRMVEREGVMHEAKFRTVRALPGTFEAGRVYYCQHLTPELIWIRELQQHRNGATSLVGLTLVADDPAAQAQKMAPWVGVQAEATGDGSLQFTTGGFRLEVMPQAVYRERYGALCCDAQGRSAYFGAIHLASSSLDTLDDVLRATSEARAFAHERSATSTAVLVAEFNALLVFHPA